MATVRLEFELDSEVYPELHAALSAMRSARARAERMRQLAAAGLVWEKVRLHGAAAIALPAEQTRVVMRPEPPSQDDEGPLPTIERRIASSVKRARANTALRRRASDIVDLAINAEPAPVPPVTAQGHRVRPSLEDVEQVIRELPILFDVVEDVAPLPEHDDASQAPDWLPAAGWSSMNAYPADAAGAPPGRELADMADHDASDLPEAALHVTSLSHKPAARSRLMRMKERGLFKNG